MSKCRHTRVWVRYADDRFWFRSDPARQAFEAEKRCATCGEQLPIGPSNDEPEAVRIEMRAAELEETEYWKPARVLTAERWGWEDHGDPESTAEDEEEYTATSQWAAGWLSGELERFEREICDVDAWHWDPTRPVAGQYEEWLAAQSWSCPVDSMECQIRRRCTNKCGRLNVAPAPIEERRAAANTAALVADLKDCAACSTSDGCAEHRMFTCASCGKAKPWDDGVDSEDVCTECWLIAHDAEEQAAHDGYDGGCEIVELRVGEEPERGVEFEPVPFTCTTPHDGECRPARWNDGPAVCVVVMRTQVAADPIHALTPRTDPLDTPIRAGAPEAIGLTPRQLREQTAAAVAEEDALRDPAVLARNAIEIKRRSEARYEAERAAEPDCRDEDGPEVERLMGEMTEESDRLTAIEAAECVVLSDSDVCQACGDKWTDHGRTCAGSEVSHG